MAKKSNYNKKDNFRGKDVNHRNDSQSRKTFSKEMYPSVSNKPNDVSWYARNPQLLKDVASLPFSHMVGRPFNIDVDGNKTTRNTPGIMSLSYAPSVGLALGADAAINVAGQNLFAAVRKDNSGSTNYQYPDMILAIIALSQAHAFHAEMRRLYGVLRYYSFSNSYLPVGMTEALGGSSLSLSTNLADFRAWLNLYAQRLNTFALPNAFSVTDRWKWLVSNVYMDRAGLKAQFYAFRPTHYYKFTETEGDITAGQLDLIPVSTWSSVNHIRTYGDNLLNSLYNSAEVPTMMGDLRKAFPTQLVTAPSTEEDYVVSPVYNYEVLHQIHNFHGVGKVYEKSINLVSGAEYSGAVVQDAARNRLINLPVVTPIGTEPHITNNIVLDVHTDAPTPADVMECTRMMTTVGKDVAFEKDGLKYYDVGFHGSEIPEYVTIYTRSSTGDLASFQMDMHHLVDFGVTNTQSLTELNFYSMFDMAPTIYLFGKLHGAEKSTFISVFGDLDNFVTADHFFLNNLHRVALYSEFAIPELGIMH